VGERAVAWVDDQLGPEVHAWAASRDAPTMLVETDHRVGLTMEHIERLREFADAAAWRSRAPSPAAHDSTSGR
jgi:hypothetical protein